MLPSLYLITPTLCQIYPDLPFEQACLFFLKDLEIVFKKGIKLVQLRQKELNSKDYERLAKPVLELAKPYGACVLFNQQFELAIKLHAGGVHLPVSFWTKKNKRPLPFSYLVGVSCHNLPELKSAQKLNPDFAVLSPILPSASHPTHPPLGWDAFAACVKNMQIPLFALGGLHINDLPTAQSFGGYGIAAIRGLWSLTTT